MTEIEMLARVKEALQKIVTAGGKKNQIIIDVSEGVPKHVNVVMEIGPKTSAVHDRGKVQRF